MLIEQVEWKKTCDILTAYSKSNLGIFHLRVISFEATMHILSLALVVHQLKLCRLEESVHGQISWYNIMNDNSAWISNGRFWSLDDETNTKAISGLHSFNWIHQ